MSIEPEPDSGEPRNDSSEPAATAGPQLTAEPDGFGRNGWALVVALVLSVLVIPGIIYVYPYAAGSFGLTFFGTYLVLPLIPAALLGLIAVWSLGVGGRAE